MRIIAISDTHGLHNQLSLPKGDMLLHTGDLSKRGTEQEIISFLNWFSKQDFKYKIFIAGNHDFYFEKKSKEAIAELIPSNVIYLEDSGVTIEGIHIWGSPVTPWFYDWAFNRQRGEDIDKHWQIIPENTDILLTHGPPNNVLDETYQGLKVGCEKLLERVELIQPKFCVFGHIHESAGQLRQNNINYINASVVNLRYLVVNDPTVFDIE